MGVKQDAEAFVLIGAGLVVLRGPARFTQRRRDAKNAESRTYMLVSRESDTQEHSFTATAAVLNGGSE